MYKVSPYIKGESSGDKPSCIVCMERCKIHISAKCVHPVCLGCARQYFNNILKNSRFNSYELIECPSLNWKQNFGSTNAILERVFLKEEVEEWWQSAIIKTFIANKIYCPMENCNGVFDVDEVLTRRCTFSECYECHRGFCLACQKAWHPEKIYKKKDNASELEETLKLAKMNRWTRCPSCSYIVKMMDGCNHITCRCGNSFCYGCGRYDNICSGECFNLESSKLNELRNHMFVNRESSSNR